VLAVSQFSCNCTDNGTIRFDDGRALEASASVSSSGPATQTNSPSNTRSTASHVPVAAIVASSVSGVVAIAVAIGAVLFWRRSHRRPKARGSELSLIDEDEVPNIALEIRAFTDHQPPSTQGDSSLPPYALTDPQSSPQDLVSVETLKVVRKVY
jgi:hypothetical protein